MVERMASDIIVRPYDGPGTVEVVDRETGSRLGYALRDFHGRWVAYPVYAGGPLVTVGVFRYRREAADAIARHARSRAFDGGAEGEGDD